MKSSTTWVNKKIWIALFWLLVWQAIAMAVDREFLVATPIIVAKTLFELMGQGEFWISIASSFSRVAMGFFGGLCGGVILAVLSAKWRIVREVLSPVLTVIKATPVASFAILCLVWFRSESLSIVISFLMVLPITYANTLAGILNVDKKLIEMARVFNLSALKKVLYIYTPQVMPFFVSACVIGISMCFKAGVAAEVIGMPRNSIGMSLYESKIFLDTPAVFAWTIVVILISMGCEGALMWLIKKVRTSLNLVEASDDNT